MAAYHGRLAFDPETGFHLSEDGKQVVTDDEGKTWRYAKDGDPSHNARHQQRLLTVDSTANQLFNLAMQHGMEQAKTMVEPHHFHATEDDPHYRNVARDDGRPEERHTMLTVDPDHEAATITGHTDSWKQS